jgi:site-specific DNA-methyltransferase (adenine-specific)
VDAIVTDPPYGLSFMGKKWDYDVPSVEIWVECLRVLKPGGHLLAFAGTRTQHRMAVRIEDAGFEIRDMIAWVYGSGFPKSLDVSKAIDKAAGVEREVVGVAGKSGSVRNSMAGDFAGGEYMSTAPATPEAQQWSGWGTALKPALEPITVARKPLVGTVAANVLEHGTGALNVDGCRVGTDGGTAKGSKPQGDGRGIYGAGLHGACEITQLNAGRWPANLIHDGSDEVVACFPANAGASAPVKGTEVSRASVGRVTGERDRVPGAFHADSGSAARFFYCAKASKADRDEGCEGLELRDRADQSAWVRKCNVCGDTFCDPQTSRPHCGHDDFSFVSPSPRRNHHPTVKPTDLMRYLCRLVTPPGGVVLDPFTGSGSTGKAAVLEGFRFIGIERDPQYIEIARARVAAVRREPEQAVLI